MKLKLEFNGYELEIDEVDGLVTVKAEKDGETIEEFTINTTEEGSQEESEDSDVKSFDEFGGEEEEDFEDESEDDVQDELEESEDESEDELEDSNESIKLESFQSFINKKK